MQIIRISEIRNGFERSIDSVWPDFEIQKSLRESFAILNGFGPVILQIIVFWTKDFDAEFDLESNE